MFGVELWHFDLNAEKRYFNVKMIHAYLDTGEYNDEKTISVPLEPCKKQHWKQYPAVQQAYDRLAVSTWLCVPLDQEYDIQGKYSSEVSKSIEVSISKCTNSSDYATPCATETQIEELFSRETRFYYTIYFINPLINADSQDHLSYYLEDSNYIIFSKHAGEECQLMMQDF